MAPEHIPYGRRLITSIIDQIAAETPDRPYISVPTHNWQQDGYVDVTYGQFAKAADKAAWWLDEQLGQTAEGSFDTFAYMGENDLRYALLVLGAIKSRRKVLLSSFTNSLKAHTHLLEATQCKTLVVSEGLLDYIKDIRASRSSLKVFVLAATDFWFQSQEDVERYPYNKTFEEAKEDPCIIFHSSGTTGNPKPLPQGIQSIASVDYLREISDESPDNQKLWHSSLINRRILCPMPLFWGLGMYMLLFMPGTFDFVPVLLPSDAPLPLTADYTDKIHGVVETDSVLYTPALLKEICQSPSRLEKMERSKIDLIIFGGAPLEQATGDTLSKFATVQSVYGSTEALAPPICHADRRDWDYLRPHPKSGIRLHQFVDDLYELVIHKQEDFKLTQPVFTHVKGDVHHSHDLFRQHPDKPNYWKFQGRTDDFVKLTSLTKFNAHRLEQIIEQHSSVKGVLVGGQGRPAPFLLLELRDQKADKGVLDAIWPAVEQANGTGFQEIHLTKERTILAATPFPRLAKGSLNRRVLLEQYEREIDALYSSTAATGSAPEGLA